MVNDLRSAFRNLLRSPGFTLVAVAVLTLGIGANTAIFSLLDVLLTRNAPGITRPEQLVVFGRTAGSFGFARFSYPDYCDYRDHSTMFSGLIAYAHTAFSMSEGDEPEQLQGAVVSNNYFAVLGVQARFDQASEQTVVVSHRLWIRRFTADPSVVGKTIRLNGKLYTVAAVAPDKYRGTELTEALDIWVPIAKGSRPDPWSNPKERQDRFLVIIGRLKPGVRPEVARAEAAVMGRQLKAAYPQAQAQNDKTDDTTLDSRIAVDPFTGELAGGFLMVLMVAATFVLLIAVANLANLLLARTVRRRKEIAVRLALGASRARLVRQLLVESLMLSLAGGVAGLSLAYFIARLLLLVTKDLRFIEPHADIRVLGFTVLVSVVAGILFGLAPALEGSRSELALVLKEESGSVAAGKSRLRSLLVILEVSLSLILLIGSSLLLQSFRNLGKVDKGFASDNVLLMSIDPERLGYDRKACLGFYRDLHARLNRIPGVAAASMAWKSALGGDMFSGRYVPDGQAAASQNSFEVHDNVVSPRYFETLKIPLLSGRDFLESDARGAPGVLIVNEALARQLWPGENPLGKKLRQAGMGLGPSMEVVGVVGNARHLGLDETAGPYLYLPMFQHEEGRVRLHVRVGGGPGSSTSRAMHRQAAVIGSMSSPILGEIRALDKNMPVFEVMSLDDKINNELSFLWSLASLVSAFGILALVLAVVGLYGVVSYSVTQRTREIGVRMALGAARADVFVLVIRQSMTLVLVGVVAGVLGALALARILDSILFGLTAGDPASYAGVSLLLVLVALAATYIPARRAAMVDPMVALRHE